MNGKLIVTRISQFAEPLKHILPVRPVRRSNLHAAWRHPECLPDFVRCSPVAQRYLDLLGPLHWDQLPERDLERNWGQVTIPYVSFIALLLLKLEEDKKSMGDARLTMVEHPELIWLFGFPLVVTNPGKLGFDSQASLPTVRHLTRLLREMPNSVLQYLLADSVRLIRAELAQIGVTSGECVSLDTKHILAWVKENNPKQFVEDRFDKTKQPAGDPDCKLGCKRRHNRRKAGSEPATITTPTKNPVPANNQSAGEFYWGYGSGAVVTKVPGWGEYVLAELTQTFDRGDVTYFFPLMRATEERLGFRPRQGTFDAAYDAWYVYEYFYRADDPGAFAAVPFAEKGRMKQADRQFSSEGLPLCEAGLVMPCKTTFTDRTRAIIEHERGKYVCPLRFPKVSEKSCPKQHKNWTKGGCVKDLPISIGTRLRYTLSRDSDEYKAIYKQRTAVERINSQAKALGIERPYLRNGAAIANQNTLIYILINLRLLQRIRKRLVDPE